MIVFSHLVIVGFILLAFSAACAPAAGPVNEESAYPGDEAVEPALGNYPAKTSESGANPQGGSVETPDGVVVVAPSGSVDLSKLTPEPPPDEEILQEMPEPGRPGNPLPAELSRMVLALGEHLAEYAGIPLRDVRLVSAEAVTWGNTALGCPQPDRAYAEVMVEGWQVKLNAQGETYTYHTDGLARFVLCEDGLPAAEGEVNS
jgi:hypothetical protein